MHTPTVSTCLWFHGDAEEAVRFYTGLIPNSRITGEFRPDPGGPPVMVTFLLDGVPFKALNGPVPFPFTEAASIVVTTPDQAETDRLWNGLIADGGSESQCAWLKDRFGLSWQIVPEALPRLLNDPDRAAAGRAMQAMFQMRKIDVAGLEKAFRGE